MNGMPSRREDPSAGDASHQHRQYTTVNRNSSPLEHAALPLMFALHHNPLYKRTLLAPSVLFWRQA